MTGLEREIRNAVCCPVFEAEETSLTQSILAECEEKEGEAALQKQQAKEMKAMKKKTKLNNKVAKWQKDHQH